MSLWADPGKFGERNQGQTNRQDQLTGAEPRNRKAAPQSTINVYRTNPKSLLSEARTASHRPGWQTAEKALLGTGGGKDAPGRWLRLSGVQLPI